jgi:hypothetical protein
VNGINFYFVLKISGNLGLKDLFLLGLKGYSIGIGNK